MGNVEHSNVAIGKAGQVVLLSLPTGDVVREVILGAAGLVGVMASGSTIVDLSTTEPKVAQDCACACAANSSAPPCMRHFQKCPSMARIRTRCLLCAA